MIPLKRCPFCHADTIRVNPVTRKEECSMCGASRPLLEKQ